MTNEECGAKKRRKVELPVLTEGEKRVVLIQFRKDRPLDNAEAILEEYLKFMYIKINSDGACTPSERIDAMWHAHILSTREYFAFCQRHGNKSNAVSGGTGYIHHDPALIHGEAHYKNTLRKYEEYFGHAPKVRIIWPEDIGEDASERRWHQEYATKYADHPNCVNLCGCIKHDWAAGQFDIECEDCLDASMCIEHEDEPELESPFGRPFTCG